MVILVETKKGWRDRAMSPVPGHLGKRSLYGKKKRHLENERGDATHWMIVSCVIMLCGVIGMAMGNPSHAIPPDMADLIFKGGIVLLFLGIFFFGRNWGILEELKGKR